MEFATFDIISTIMRGGFYLCLIAFSIHALVLGYHWLTFGTSVRTSTIALATYLTGGAILLNILALSVYGL